MYMNNGTLIEEGMQILKKMKAAGIVISIIMFLLGICMFIEPISTSIVMIWLMVFGLLLIGIGKIVSFCRMPKGGRDGFLLATGILLIIASILLICRGLNFGFAVTANIMAFVAIMIGFICVFSGIGRICMSGVVAECGGSKGLTIVSGILEIICGMLVLCAPITGLFALTVAFGLFLGIMGVAMFIRFVSL